MSLNDYVGVDVRDLRDFKTDSVQVFWQFSIGGFLFSGGFWLAVERFFTGQIDTLFWVCLVIMFTGLVIGYYGLSQLSRKINRIDTYLKDAGFDVD